MTLTFRLSPFIVPALLAGQPLSAQLLRPNFVTPDFSTQQSEYGNWEYSCWDRFYTPHDLAGTKPQNKNYPDQAAPNGYAVRYEGSDEIGPLGDVEESPPGSGKYVYVGPFNGEWVWDGQTYEQATAKGYAEPLPTNPNPSLPLAIFHAKNPSIRQHSNTAFIIGPGYAGNIYSFSNLVSYTLDDAVDYNAEAVVLQLQNQGRDLDMSSIVLKYQGANGIVTVAPTDTIIERQAFASHSGFTFTTRTALEWDLSGLGVNKYQIEWKAGGTSSSVQRVLLDSADNYVRDKGLPAKRFFNGAAGSNWSQGANWNDVAGNHAVPTEGANVVLQSGTSLNIGSTTRKISMLEGNLPGNFTVDGTSTLELGTGYHSIASAVPKSIVFNVPVKMTAFNFFDVGSNETVVLNRTFSGDTGFEKRGAGDLKLAGNNTFTGALFVSGGRLTVSGSNVYGGGDLDLTYIYLGELVLESSGVLGSSGVKVAIGSTPYELVGETTPSRLIVKGQRTFSNPVEFTGGFNPKSLTFTNTGTGSTLSSAVTLHNATVSGMFGAEAHTGDFDLDTPLATDQVRLTGTFVGGATVAGTPTPNALHKKGAGTLVFGGSSKAYKHQTSIDGGKLLLESGTGITGGNSVFVKTGATFTAEGPVTLAASKLIVDGVMEGAGALVRTGSVVIGGAGTIAKPLTIDQGTSISPGSGVGALTLTGNQTWGKAGRYILEVDDAESASGHDKANIAGSLAITATSASKFVIEVRSLTQAGAAGQIHNFNSYSNYAWTIASASGGVTGFSVGNFTVDSSAFTNTLAGTFSVELQGQDIVVRYTRTAAPANSFAAWAASFPVGLRGANDDADQDGISNLIEFTLGTSGTMKNVGLAPLKITRQTTDGVGSSLLEFAISEPFRPGVTVQLVGSTDLGPESWSSIASKAGLATWQGPGVVIQGALTSGRRTFTVQIPDPATGEKSKFFRLQLRNE